MNKLFLLSESELYELITESCLIVHNTEKKDFSAALVAAVCRRVRIKAEKVLV